MTTREDVLATFSTEARELFDRLKGRENVTVESLGPAIRGLYEALESAENEARLIKRLQQAARLSELEKAELEFVSGPGAAAEGVLMRAARVRKELDDMVSALRTLDHYQEVLEGYLAKMAIRSEAPPYDDETPDARKERHATERRAELQAKEAERERIRERMAGR